MQCIARRLGTLTLVKATFHLSLSSLLIMLGWSDRTTGTVNSRNPDGGHMNKFKNIMAVILCAVISQEVAATCVSSINTTKPNGIYINHGNGTVTDQETGLMWMRCSLGQSGTSCTGSAVVYDTWKSALEAALSANSGSGTFGYTDWRLPNVAELDSLVEVSCFDPAINASIFPNTMHDVNDHWYWSSSVAHLKNTTESNRNVRCIGFYNGSNTSCGKYQSAGEGFYIRLVRGGL